MNTPTRTTAERVWLVAHDFSPCADEAARLALDDLLDSRTGGRLVLAHTFVVLIPQGVMDAPVGELYANLERSSRIEATHALERVAESLLRIQKERFNGAPPVKIDLSVRIGPAAETILAEAETCGASRIVVGTHGRTGISHLLIGSVAERIVRLSKIPVLVAHKKAQAAQGGAP